MDIYATVAVTGAVGGVVFVDTDENTPHSITSCQ